MATETDPLGAALAALGETLKAMTGLERWYDDPPENVMEFPCGMAYASNGEMSVISAGLSRGVHTLRVDIYQSRAVLPVAINAAKVWPYRVLHALRDDPTLGGTVAAVAWPIRYQMGPLLYAANEAAWFGVRFEIPVKVMGA